MSTVATILAVYFAVGAVLMVIGSKSDLKQEKWPDEDLKLLKRRMGWKSYAYWGLCALFLLVAK